MHKCTFNDELMNNLSDHDLEKIQYHVKTCYASYKGKGEKNEQKKSKLKRISEEPIESLSSRVLKIAKKGFCSGEP